MVREHKHYSEASILARKIYADFERIYRTTKYKIDENKISYSINRYPSDGISVSFVKGNHRNLFTIYMAYKPKKANLTDEDTNWLKVSHAFMTYIKNNYYERGNVKHLLNILPSYRQFTIDEILTDLA